MLETYKVGVVLELSGNVQSGIDKLIMQMESLDRRAKDVGSTFLKLKGSIDAIGMAGRSISLLSRAMEKLGTSGNRGVADFEKMATAAQSMTTASERMTAALRDSAKLAADVARATETAARASSTTGRASGRGQSRGAGGHDLMLAGLGASAVGSTLLHGSETMAERGMQMGSWRTAIMADKRVTEAQADAAVAAAYAAATTAPGTTPIGNTATFAKLKTITGSFDEAVEMLPDYARLMTLIQTVDRLHGGKGHGGDQGYAAAKAAEVLGMMSEDVTDPATGGTRQVFNPKLLKEGVDRFSRIASAELGNVMPTDILGLAKQGAIAGMTMDPAFMWEKLPAMVQVWGGPRTGTALQSLLQVFGPGGKLEPKVYDNLAHLGLADPAGHKRWREADPLTGKMRTREAIDPTQIANYPLLLKDPAEWAHKASLLMEQAGIHGTSDQALNIMSGAQRSTIARLLADLIKDYSPILKTQENIQNQRNNLPQYYAEHDPMAHLGQMQAAFERLTTTLGSASTTDVVRAMDAVTGGLNRLSDWAKDNKGLSRVIVDTVAGLGAIATALGTLSTAVFLFGPALRLLGIGGGAAAGGAAAGGAGGWLGTVSRAAMGGAGAGAAAVGAAIYLGGTTDPIEAERRLNLTRQQQRSGANLTPQDADAEGRPINLRGNVMLDGKQVGTFVGNSLARGASGPSSGTTGFDIRAGTAGGLAAIP